MNKLNSTYRFLAALLALTLLVSTGLPISLHAHGGQHDKDENSGEIAMNHSAGDTGDSHEGSCEDHSSREQDKENNAEECKLHIDCACSMYEPLTRANTASFSSSKIILPFSTLELDLDKLKKAAIRDVDRHRVSVDSPPIFLLVSSFLN